METRSSKRKGSAQQETTAKRSATKRSKAKPPASERPSRRGRTDNQPAAGLAGPADDSAAGDQQAENQPERGVPQEAVEGAAEAKQNQIQPSGELKQEQADMPTQQPSAPEHGVRSRSAPCSNRCFCRDVCRTPSTARSASIMCHVTARFSLDTHSPLLASLAELGRREVVGTDVATM